MAKGKGQAFKQKPNTVKEQAPSSLKGKKCAPKTPEGQLRRSTRIRKVANDDTQVVPSAVPSTSEQKGGSISTQPKPSTSAAARKSQREAVSKSVVPSRPSIIDHDRVILDVVNEGLFPTQDLKFKEFDALIFGILEHKQDLGLSEQEKEKWDNAVAQLLSIRNVANERRRSGREVEVQETTAEKSVQTLNEVESVSTQVTNKDLGEPETSSGRLNGKQKGSQPTSSRKSHKARVHLEKSHILSCLFCEKQFPNNSKLESHLISHTLERPYLCRRCPAEFTEQIPAIRHFRKAHSKTRRSFKCKKCSKSFLHKKSLTNHIREHRGQLHLKCKSPDCVMRFASLQKRDYHFLKVHVGKRFRCTVCRKQFLPNST